MLDYRHRSIPSGDQIELLEQLIDNSFEVTYSNTDSYPGKEELNNLISLLHNSISNSENHQILVELQLILFLTIIQGISLSQAILLNLGDWNNLENLDYQGKDLQIGTKNSYCTKLILMTCKGSQVTDRIFRILNPINVIECLNLYLVMNGFEYVLSERKLEILFGRFLYLRYGTIRSVREFLKEYFICDSHIELLVKLKLVDSVHYNTMMRN